jgi:hypothetical protein
VAPAGLEVVAVVVVVALLAEEAEWDRRVLDKHLT